MAGSHGHIRIPATLRGGTAASWPAFVDGRTGSAGVLVGIVIVLAGASISSAATVEAVAAVSRGS